MPNLSLLHTVLPFLMETWRSTSILPFDVKDETFRHPSRALEVTSGNAQSYALDIKEGIENQVPDNSQAFTQHLTKTSPCPYPALPTTHVNLDHHQTVRLKLDSRKQRREVGSTRGLPFRAGTHLERPYLKDPRYIEYRLRQRRDTGADGNPVWDDATEEAFQEGKFMVFCRAYQY